MDATVKTDIQIPMFVPDIQEQDIAAATEVLRSGMLVQGKNVAALEAAFCKITGAKHAIAVSNGTATLHLILHALGIGIGDEVIVPAFSYVATANAVELVGATPVFVDIDMDNCNILVDRIEEKISPKTRAIMPVHEFGLAANMDAIRAIAQKHGLQVIEDAACAVGASWQGERIGKHSDFASFSLHPRKAITSGEGGIIVTNSDAMAEKFRIFRNHGIQLKDGEMDFVAAGFNYRMTDFQAALVLSQTQRLEAQISHKQRMANGYLKALQNTDLLLPKIPDFAAHTWQTFHVVLPDRIDRKTLLQQLKNVGIGAGYGAQCIPATTFYQQKYALPCEAEFPNALRAYNYGLALPMFPNITEEQVQYVTEKLKQLI